MTADSRTIQTYDDSAGRLAAHFDQYEDGVARIEIDKAFALAGEPVKQVVEIGCGAGKDAGEIAARCEHYEGFDPSAGLLAIAKEKNPTLALSRSDALSYTYPPQTDIVFAFASLLHLDQDDFTAVGKLVAASLRPGGVFCMTLKEAATYTEQMQEDDFGVRLFYLYPLSDVQAMLGAAFRLAYEEHSVSGPKAKQWMSLIFVRQ